MPKATFIIPVKDGENFIEHTLNSVLKQTLADLEIIVVNDHSTDNTVKVVNKVKSKDKRIKFFDLKDKKGPAAARNYGINNSKGEIIFPTDADDPCYPERAEVSIKELQENKADIFYSNLMRYYSGSNKKELRHFQPYDEKLLHFINFIAHAGSSAYYRYVFDKVGGYDENILIGEDYSFWLSAQELGFKFCYKNLPLSQYTMHSNQITISNDPEKIAKRQYWNKIIREKHKIYNVDLNYVKSKATAEVLDFYINKNYDIWFGKDSIPRNN